MSSKLATHRNIVAPTTHSVKLYMLIPLLLFLLMECAALLLYAVLSLRGLWFHEALLTVVGAWILWPTFLLFPGLHVLPPIPHVTLVGTPYIPRSAFESLLLFGAFLIVFGVYIYTLRRLPQSITSRYIAITTILLGLTFAFIPVVTSSDVYAYIAYARIGVLYHLNPLTTLPTAISHDAIYNYLSWKDQPSAYGPVWIAITSFLQWLMLVFNSQYLLPILIALRFLGLITHLACTWLVWQISGRLTLSTNLLSSRRRLLATLAFAWNPLLLLEACTNAHVDVVTLFFLLLALWLLVQKPYLTLRTMLLSVATLALASCIKINIVLLFPFFLLFLSHTPTQRLQKIFWATLTYAGIIVLLYAPFWQNGALLNLLKVSPVTTRNINSPAQFVAFLYDSISTRLGYPVGTFIGSPAEHITHTLTTVVFVLVYLALCGYVLRHRHIINTPRSLIRLLALVWLLYCIGSPWFWPWYLVTFFGLYALLMATEQDVTQSAEIKSAMPSLHSYFTDFLHALCDTLLSPLLVGLLTLTMLDMYCFYAWAFAHSFIAGLPNFQWQYLSGLYIWLPLLVAVVTGWSRKKKVAMAHSQNSSSALEEAKP